MLYHGRPKVGRYAASVSGHLTKRCDGDVIAVNDLSLAFGPKLRDTPYADFDLETEDCLSS